MSELKTFSYGDYENAIYSDRVTINQYSNSNKQIESSSNKDNKNNNSI